MPYYSFDLIVPKNTAREAPASSKVILTFGIIDRCEIQFPAGCAGLAGAQVWVSAHQLYPTNDGAWLKADNYVVPISDAHPFFQKPYEVTLRGYNDDDTYQHMLTFRFNVVRVQDTLASKLLAVFRTRNVPEVGI